MPDFLAWFPAYPHPETILDLATPREIATTEAEEE
jgi:hypothetical protein